MQQQQRKIKSIPSVQTLVRTPLKHSNITRKHRTETKNKNNTPNTHTKIFMTNANAALDTTASMRGVTFYGLSSAMELSKLYIYDEPSRNDDKKKKINGKDVYISNLSEKTMVPSEYPSSMTRTDLWVEVKAWLFANYPDQYKNKDNNHLDDEEGVHSNSKWIERQGHRTIRVILAYALFEVIGWNETNAFAEIAFWNVERNARDTGWIQAIKEGYSDVCVPTIKISNYIRRNELTNYWCDSRNGQIFRMKCLHANIIEEGKDQKDMRGYYNPQLIKDDDDSTQTPLAFCQPVTGRIWKASRDMDLRCGPSMADARISATTKEDSGIKKDQSFEEIRHIWRGYQHWVETLNGWVLIIDVSTITS